ncbi:hypothetical protein HVY71_00430 [Citrobacter freundii]|nr:hypothetical protein HVY71_00430 [Citrobacter freundii]
MFHLDNNSGVSAMPPVGTVQSSAPRWFTEGGGGTPASYPGADWYNIIQAELLNFLSAYGIAPDKADLSQLQKAIEAAIKDKATAKSPLLTAIAALVTSADKMPYFNGKDTVAMTALTAFAREVLAQTDAAGVLSKLQLGEAAKRDVGSGAGQVPDMSNFQSGGGWFKLPSGYVIQAFEASFDSNGLYINFPIPFPSSVIAIVPGVLMSTTASPSLQFPSIQRDVNDLTRFFAKYNMGGMNSSYFIAIGK